MKKVLLSILCVTLIACSEEDGISTDETNRIEQTGFLGELDWVYNFGGSNEESAQAVIETSDGGYAVFGYTNSIDGNLTDKTTEVNDFWLVKLDAEGNMQWNKTYGGSGDDRGQSIVQTADEGFAIVGYAMSSDGDGSNNEGFHDNWILKLDPLGNIEWERSFGFSGHDHSYDVLQTTDGGFFFVGFLDITASEGEGGESTNKRNTRTRHGVGEFWCNKLDADGNLEWRQFFGGTGNDRAFGAVQANDGGFVITGSSESNDFDISNSSGSYDFWAIKITAQGDLVWENSFGGTGIDKAWDISNTNDNGYVITGNTFSDDTDISKNNGASDVWLVKIDDAGKMVWEKTYGGSGFDSARAINIGADGGFVICGNSKSIDADLSDNAGENDIWLIKTDTNGNMEWQKTFGGAGLDFGFDAIETKGGSIVLVGEMASEDFPDLQNKGKADAVVIKIK